MAGRDVAEAGVDPGPGQVLGNVAVVEPAVALGPDDEVAFAEVVGGPGVNGGLRPGLRGTRGLLEQAGVLASPARRAHPAHRGFDRLAEAGRAEFRDAVEEGVPFG